MEKNGNYNIVLQQGKALKSFFELTEEEHKELARRVFERVSKLAAQVGALPVTIDTINSFSQKSKF